LNSFYDFDLNLVDGYHFFNAVSFGKKPWVTSFETSLPRWGEVSRKTKSKGHDLIAKPQCTKLLALSDCAANILKKELSEYQHPLAEDILAKIQVLHPSQKVLVEKKEPRNGNKVIFAIIGSDFFRKGGKEILQVFDHLFEQGKRDWHLNIVSKMAYGDYASKTTKSDFLNAKQLIEKMNGHISYYYSLPNTEVLKILMGSDVGLLPTYADTYGYSVLEAQAAGCPVITTNVRALPEINNHRIGWVLDVPKDEFGNAVLTTESDRNTFSNILSEQLYQTVHTILEGNEADLIKKGNEAIGKIRQENNPSNNARILKGLYSQFLSEA
jgi:glycosyltransferase involved in cell wall biosynthesis